MAAVSLSLSVVSFSPDTSLPPPPYLFSRSTKGVWSAYYPPIIFLDHIIIYSTTEEADDFFFQPPVQIWIGWEEWRQNIYSWHIWMRPTYHTVRAAVLCFSFLLPRLSKPDADGRKSCHYCLFISFPLHFFTLFLCQLLNCPLLPLLLHPFPLVINWSWSMTFSAWLVCLLPCSASGALGMYP